MKKISIEKAKKHLQAKVEREKAAKQKEFESIVLACEKLQGIWEKYNVQKVFLYGSVIDGSFTETSDIDIAIDVRIDYDAFLKLYSEVDICFHRDIDIRLLEELPFSKGIREKGVIVYERKNHHIKK